MSTSGFPGLFQDFKPNFQILNWNLGINMKIVENVAYAGLYFEHLSLKNIFIISNSA